MKWIEEVQEALDNFVTVYERHAGIQPFYYINHPQPASTPLYSAYKQAKKALAAIPDEDPMEGLLRWLDDIEDQIGLMSTTGNAVTSMVRTYIEQELGYRSSQEE